MKKSPNQFKNDPKCLTREEAADKVLYNCNETAIFIALSFCIFFIR